MQQLTLLSRIDMVAADRFEKRRLIISLYSVQELNRMGIVPNVWKEDRVIESFDVDILGRLRPQMLFSYLLNSAWNHTRGTNYGYEALTAKKLIWVLIKVQIVIKRVPKWGEQIAIRTWGKEAVRFYALRDFIVLSEAGEKLVSATSSWMILDQASGRPQRFDQKESFPWRPGEDEIVTSLEKVPGINGGKKLARFNVFFSDIDMNRHVNSAKYLQWMMDSHSYGHLENNELRAVDLSFLSEALPNDEVEVFSEETGEQKLCSVRRTADGKELCRGRFEWSRPL
jgi:acyl-ACP thioesterase